MIRADAGGRLGIGHVMRCLALAQEWQRKGGQVDFLCARLPLMLRDRLESEGMRVRMLDADCVGVEQSARELVLQAQRSGAEWIIVDGYQFGVDFQEALKELGLRVLVLDDYGHCGRYAADLVLNQNIHASEALYESRDPATRVLLGSTFALIRSEFENLRDDQTDRSNDGLRVLVTLGGTDPDNLTSRLIYVLDRLSARMDLAVRVVVGPGNRHRDALVDEVGATKGHFEICADDPDMVALYRWADTALVAGGSTNWELCFAGVPPAMIVLAENQRQIAESMEARGLGRNLGWHEDFDATSVESKLYEFLSNGAARKQMASLGRRQVDGHGAARVIAAMTNRLRVTIATAREGWMVDAIDRFVSELEDGGHQVAVVTADADVPSSDIVFLLSFWSIVSKEVLDRNSHVLVVHASALPEGKGWSPLTWQILEGRNEIPLTLFEAQQSVDSGNIYDQRTLRFHGHELIDNIRETLTEATFAMCSDFVAEYPLSAMRGRPQDGAESFYRRRGPKDSELDPDRSIAEQFDLLRTVDNEAYPAFFRHRGHRYQLKIERIDEP